MRASDLWISGPQLLLSRARQWRPPEPDPAIQLLDRPGVLSAINHFRRSFFAAQQVNQSEHRAAGHWALRLAAFPRTSDQLPSTFAPNGIDLLPKMAAEHQRCRETAHQIRSGQSKTASGLACTDIIHIGIGGSDTGPHLLIEALSPLTPSAAPRPHFLPNLDAHVLARRLATLDPSRTLVVIVSKSFSTLETMANAQHCLKWMKAHGIKNASDNFFAVTATPEKAMHWGIEKQRIFYFDESIGGRYSLWGPVSLTARVALGNPAVDDVLKGGAEMDQHFLSAAPAENLPMLLAASDLHNLHHRGIATLMVSAYDSRLQLLLPYLKQLWMESLGKGVDQSGQPLRQPACPILWGDVGTNAQHAFFQLLHQGHTRVAIELIGVIHPDHSYTDEHRALIANLIAQAQALSLGQQHLRPEKICPGGHPVNLLMLNRCNGAGLGSLIALWEYRVMCLAAMQNINPYDQWGVELGKSIADTALKALSDNDSPAATADLDAISLATIASLRTQMRQTE